MRQELETRHRQELADRRQAEEQQLEALRRPGDQDAAPLDQQQQHDQGPPQALGAEGGGAPASRNVAPTEGVQQEQTEGQQEILQLLGVQRLQQQEEAALRRQQQSRQEGLQHQDPRHPGAQEEG